GARELNPFHVITRESAAHAEENVVCLLLRCDGQLNVAEHETAGGAGMKHRIDNLERAVRDAGLRCAGAVAAWQRQQISEIPATVGLSPGRQFQAMDVQAGDLWRPSEEIGEPRIAKGEHFVDLGQYGSGAATGFCDSNAANFDAAAGDATGGSDGDKKPLV